MSSFKVKKINNHWYPCIPHDKGYLPSLCDKLDKYLTILDVNKFEELTIDFEEVGVILDGENIIYFNEYDITRYCTTDDNFDLRFIVNSHEFLISSDFYWILEDVFNFNFHKASYRVYIY